MRDDDIVEDLIAYNYARTGKISTNPCDPEDDSGNNSGNGKQSGGCFIATAAYGSPLEHQVILLQEFRDENLSQTAFGRRFIEFYYKFSPPVADVIRAHDFARLFVRAILAPVVMLVRLANRSQRG